MDVTVRSAMDNSLLYDATVKWAIPSEGGVSGTGSTGSDGVAILQVDGAHLPTDVELTASLDGYEVFFVVKCLENLSILIKIVIVIIKNAFFTRFTSSNI